MKKAKHGVVVQYGETAFKLSADDLQLIADALCVVNPDSDKATRRARHMALAFESLSEYAESLKGGNHGKRR